MLGSWRDTPTREAIVSYGEGAAQAIPPEERKALDDAPSGGWTVVSVNNDWAVFS